MIKLLQVTPKQKGLTLVEVLIALALSAVLTTAVYQTVLSNRVNIELSDSYALVQESGRLTMNLLSRDFRMLGYMGCVNNTTKVNNLLDTDTSKGYNAKLHDFSSSIDAVDNYDSGSDSLNLATLLGHTPVQGSDILLNRSATMSDLTIGQVPSSEAENLKASGPADQVALLKEGLVLMITDCTEADVFAVSNTTTNSTVPHNKNVSNGPDNSADDLSKIFGVGSQILLMNSTVHFIAPSSVINNVNSLYKYSTLTGVSLELVPYVESMQLLYGVDTDANFEVDQYLTKTEIDAGGYSMTEDVYSIDVNIVVAGEKNVEAPVPTNYKVNGVVPSDGKLRKRYSRVIQIRNAAIGNDA